MARNTAWPAPTGKLPARSGHTGHPAAPHTARGQDLHFDHKNPWPRDDTNTVNNIQLPYGIRDRRKGTDDIPPAVT